MPSYDSVLFVPPAPVSNVLLRDPLTGRTTSDIPLLVDSSARVTVVPQPVLSQIGITIDSNETYEVQSFDRRLILGVRPALNWRELV